MQKVITNDGSITYRNPDVDETYHSHSGALNEALKKYVIPAGIADRNSSVTVLDVCYGLGYNSFVALSFWLEHSSKNINFVSIENDPEIVRLGTELKLPTVLQYSQNFFAQLAAHPGVVCTAPQCSGVMYIEDLQVALPKIDSNSVDMCFFDPFSPKKAPHLWTKDIFVELYRVMRIGGALTTYSCARVARDAMRQAGFTVEDGPVVGRRSPSTIARKI